MRRSCGRCRRIPGGIIGRGRITTKGGAVYPFGYEDIVKGSGYISAQCCGSAEIEMGTVYAAEMGVTLFSQMD